eukprot:15456203-Alexandrium_andersonii.AAC.1
MHVGADEDCDGVGEHAHGDDARADVRLGGVRGTGETAMCALECDRDGVAERGLVAVAATLRPTLLLVLGVL